MSGRVLYVFVVLFLATNISLAKYKSEVFTEINEDVAYRKLLKIEETIQKTIEDTIKTQIAKFYRSSSDFNVRISAQCTNSLLQMVNGIRDLKLWAIQVLDSIGKPRAGMLRGTVSMLGNKRQCLDVVFPTLPFSTNKSAVVRGMHCLALLQMPLPPKSPRRSKNLFATINATFESEVFQKILIFGHASYFSKFPFGLCLPSTCEADLHEISSAIANQEGSQVDFVGCTIKQEGGHVGKDQWAIMIILLILIVFNVLGTALDFVAQYFTNSNFFKWKLIKFCSIFSLKSNFHKTMETTKPTHTLDCLNGIKYLSFVWIGIYHAYTLQVVWVMREPLYIYENRSNILSYFISAGYFAVLIFLFITGTLISFTVIKKYDSSKSFNPLILIFNRALRILPSVLIVLALVMLRNFVSFGLVGTQGEAQVIEKCRSKWWTLLLFVQNFQATPDFLCVGQMWYISLDMQCLLLAAIYFLLLFWKPWVAFYFLGTVVVVSQIAVGILTYIYNLAATASILFIESMEEFTEYMETIYYMPFPYFGLYSTGLVFGTYLARPFPIKLSKLQTFLAWTGSLTMFLAMIFIPHIRASAGYNFTNIHSAIYASTHKLFIGFSLVVITFLLTTGKGGWINDFLSWRGFRPLARISFLGYLLHYDVIYLHLFNLQGPVDATNSTQMMKFFGSLSETHILAFFLYVTVEEPFSQIRQKLFTWIEKRPDIQGKKR